MIFRCNGNYHFRAWPPFLSLNEGQWPNFTVGCFSDWKIIVSLRLHPRYKWTWLT